MKADNGITATGFIKPELSVRFLGFCLYKKTICDTQTYENNYHIIYNLKGDFQIVCGGNIFDFKVGDVAFFKPFEKYDLVSLDEKNPSSVVVFDFHKSVFEDTPNVEEFLHIFNDRPKGKDFIIESKNLKHFSVYNSIISPVKNYVKHNLGIYHFKAATAMLITNLSLVFDEIYENIPSRHSSEHGVKIYDYIGNNFSSDISINQISQKFSVSKVYINKVTKKFYGMNFHDTITSMRMWYADILIKERVELKEISRLCGYANYSGFYKAFKKFFNQTPTERVDMINKYNRTQKPLL